MKFLAVLSQHGEGCDYTIGCGTKQKIIDADSVEDAQEKILYPDGMDEQSILDESDRSYQSLYIIPMEHVVNINLESITEKIKEFKEKFVAKQLSDDEAEFERFKKEIKKIIFN